MPSPICSGPLDEKVQGEDLGYHAEGVSSVQGNSRGFWDDLKGVVAGGLWDQWWYSLCGASRGQRWHREWKKASS